MENSADSVRKLANHVNLFSNVKYYLSGVVKEEVVKCLNDGGAEGTNYFSDFVTHCILGDNYSEGDAIDARDLYEVPAVVEDWVSLSVKCKKLLPTKPFSAIDTKLFANVTVCLSQVSYADCRNLWSLITFNGGRCDLALHDKITHLIVSKPQGSKYNFVVTNETTIKIVTPDWLVDCVRRNTICDEELYHPRLLLSSKSSSFKLEKLDRQISQRKTFKDEETNVLAENPSCDKKVSSDIITAQSSLPIEIKVDEPVAVCKVDTDVNKQMQPIRCSPVLSTQTQPSTGVTEALDTSSQLTLPQQILHIRMVQTTSALSAPKPPKSLSTISSISSDTTALSSKQSSTPSTSTQLTVVSSTSAGEPITTNVTVPSTLTQLLQNNSSIIRHQQVSSSNQNYTPTPYSTQQIPEYIKQELFGQLPQQRQKLSQQQVQQLKVSQPQVQQQKIPQQQLTQQQINQQQSQQIPPQQQQQVVQQQLTQQQQVVQQQLTQQQQVVQQQVIQQQQQLTHQQQHQITPQQKQILQQQLTQHKQVLQQQQVTQQQLAQQKQVLQQQLSQQVTQQQQLSQQVTQQQQLSQQVSQQQQLSQQVTQQQQLSQQVTQQQQLSQQVTQQQQLSQQVTQQQQLSQQVTQQQQLSQQVTQQQQLSQQVTQQQQLSQQVTQQQQLSQQVTQQQQLSQQVTQQQQLSQQVTQQHQLSQQVSQQQQQLSQQQFTQQKQGLQQHVIHQQQHQVIQQQEQQVTQQQQVTQHQQIVHQQVIQQQGTQQQQQVGQQQQVTQHQQIQQQVSQQQQQGAQQQQQVGRQQQVTQHQQLLQQPVVQQQGAQQQVTQHQQILQQQLTQQQIIQQQQQQQQVLQVPQQQQVLQQVSQQQQVLQQVSQQQQVLQQVPPQQQQQQLSQQQQILQQIPQQQQVPQQLQQQQQVPQQLQQQQQVQLQQLQQQQLRQQQLQQQIQQQLQQLQQSSQHLQSQPVQQLQQQSPQMQTQQTALTPSQLQQQQALLIQKRNLHQQRILLQQQLLQQSGGTAHWRPSNLQIVSGQAATAPTATTPDSVGSVVWQQQQQLPQQGSQHVTQSPQQQRSPHLQQVHIRGADQHSVITTWTRQIPGQSQSGDEMIQLDAKTHQQLQLMSNAERVAFVNKLKLQRQLLQQQGSAQLQQLQQRQQIIRQPLQGTQTIIRAISQQLMPPGLSQHQQIEWLQQHQTQIRQQQLLQQQQQGLSKTQTLMTVKGNIIQQVPSAQQGQIQQQTAQPNQQQILSTVIQNNASTGQTAVAIGSPQHLAQLQQQRHQQHLQRLQLLQETHKQQLQQPVVSSSPTAVPFAPQMFNYQQNLPLPEFINRIPHSPSPQQLSQPPSPLPPPPPPTPVTPIPSCPSTPTSQFFADIDTNYHREIFTPANSSQIQSQLSPQQAAPTQHSPQQQPHQQTLVVNPKTKTALANMLSIRLQGSVTSPQHQQPSAVQMLNEQPEMSAAGQLRMMTAQHHAVQRMQPSLPPPPTTPTAQLQYHVSRTPQAQSTTVPVSRGARAVANAINVVKTQMGYNNSASRVAAALAKCAAGQAAAHNFNPQTRFFGHTPGLHVPPEKCLLGCIFLIVEYDRHAEYGSNVNKWHQVIEENGGEVETSYTLRLTHILCMTQKHPLVQQGLRDGKRCITADWLSDILLKQLVVPPYYALHLPVSFSDERPCRHFIMSLSGFKGEERARIKYMVELTGAKITSYFSSDNNFLICRRLEGKKVKKAREIGKPIVNVQWLNELLFGHFTCLQQPDNPKYQQYNLNNPFKIDYTLVIHLMAAWKTPIIIPIEMYEKAMINASPHGVKRKRSRLSTSGIMDSDQENSDASLNDVPITNPNPPAPSDRPVVLFSGFINPISEQKIVKQLGGEIGKSCRDATHLVMKQPVRTFKFLCAISVCKHIVNLNWLTDSLAHNTFLDETSYAVNDVRVSDGSLICDVKSVLQSVTRKELFQGKIFYITPGVIPAASALREIIECAGGLVEKQRRSLKSVLEMKPLTYLAITCNGDLHLVADLVQSEYGVYSAEFVLSAVMTQTVQYDSVFKKPKLSVSN